MAEITAKRPIRVIWKDRAWQIDPDGRVYTFTQRGVLRRVKNPVICRDVVKAVMDSKAEERRKEKEELERRLRRRRVGRVVGVSLCVLVVLLMIWRLV